VTTPHAEQAAVDTASGGEDPAPSDDPGRITPPTNGPSAAGEVVHEIRADLYYIASDLRSLARHAPPQKAPEILALSDLIASVATKWV
jgi:hypothetical protein